MFNPSFPQKKHPWKIRIFTGDDIINGKSSMLYHSNLCTRVAEKYQACANYVPVSLWRHYFDGKWNTDLQIQN